MGLIAADLRALANLPTNAVGRRMTLGLVTGLGLLALLSWWLADAVMNSTELRQAIGINRHQDVIARLLGYGWMTCPMVATWLGLDVTPWLEGLLWVHCHSETRAQNATTLVACLLGNVLLMGQ